MNVTDGSAKLARVLQAIAHWQVRDVLAKIDLKEGVPDLTHWIETTATATKPILLELYRQGMLRTAARVANATQVRPSDRGRDGMRTYSPGNETIFGPAKTKVMVSRKYRGAGGWPIIKATGGNRTINVQFDTYNPRVSDAVDAAVMEFCRETMATVHGDLKEALTDLRALLKEGLSKGDALAYLARQVNTIFTDPARAFRIATTEANRALNGGSLMAARESGVKLKKSWLASSDACPSCLELTDLGEIDLDKPFVVLKGGGPYARIMHPPLHPHCTCQLNEVLA